MKNLKLFVDELRSNNSLNFKKETLLKWKFEILQETSVLHNILHFVYDYDKQYYVTSENVIKHYFDDLSDAYRYSDLYELLIDLSCRYITGYQAIHSVVDYIKRNEEYKDLILNIIDKDLKVGISATTINKIFPNFIKEFKVALAQKLDKEVLDSSYVCSHKLDGCRCIMIAKNRSDIKFYSRQGKEFDTLNKLKDSIQQMFDKGILSNNTVLDGEICIVDENNKEDFQSIIKEIKRKDHTIQNPMYIVFDRLTIDEFNNGTSELGYRDRMVYVDTLCNSASLANIKHIRAVEHFDYTEEEFKKWQQKVIDNGWEGLIARKDVKYENKRSKNMLKIKSFCDAEYEVLGVEEGVQQEVINGVSKQIKCIGSLIIEHKGNKVNVGTGLSLEQRKRWYTNPEEIVGKIITVKYFEETKDQNGEYSLRFPVLKTIYDGKRDI